MNPKLIAGGVLAAMLLTAASAQAATFTFTTMMTGAADYVPAITPGFGSAQVTFDDAALAVTVNETWENLLGAATINHRFLQRHVHSEQRLFRLVADEHKCRPGLCEPAQHFVSGR
jgi:hypothetical protein